MSEKNSGSTDSLFALPSVKARAQENEPKATQNGAERQNRPETPRQDGKFTSDALSDIRHHVSRSLAVAWWPSWPKWASTETRQEWDAQEAANREVHCLICGASYAEACHTVVDVEGGRSELRLRVAHMARHKAREDLAARTDAEGDDLGECAVELTDDGRAYLASLRNRVAASERLQRIGDGLSPLVVDGEGEVRS